ncbi:hypothetical protein A0J57_11620 [Sphingobium sp. 22B]|uniref:putative entry exclusion protein TrbK-alt n=1 Tax=unclassified Sphingobium TaxID=2611147 RepID=UPI000782150E|nr:MULTISPECIES: putative entry exclusion protein TrbK-alt [unclassified Sphingobium]KXU32393.1 hypothetical protein AXW74_08210 [Sphingobium sp. AM]KYC32286.1 hypothetical protein A0J57_11620 [Sphingobium sp. 22B]OAP31916.1 hypothetical protein A8O16_11415 [Sphingobium sp. 20006FA]
MTDDRAPRGRFGLPNWRTLAVAAAGIGTVTGMIGLMALRDPAPSPSRFAVVADSGAAPAPASDPLMAELLRCRSLPAGSDDAECQQAWEVNRRRFLGESRSYVAPPTPARSPDAAAPMNLER